MKIKMHLGIIALLVVLLGTYLEQSNVPNQQIVVQFSDKSIASQLSDETIKIVSKELIQLGAENIQIGEQKGGKVKITYFSSQDVKHIQVKLSAINALKFSLTSDKSTPKKLPAKGGIKDYFLDVSEIENNNDTNWGFKGVLVVEQSQKSDRLFNIKFECATGSLISKYHNLEVANAFQINSSIENAINTFSHKIPETRAGPLL